MYLRATLIFLCLSIISGCADGDGNHTILSTSTLSYFVIFEDQQVVQGGTAGTTVDTTASATANLTLDLDSGILTASVSLNGLDASGVTLSKGKAGEIGTMLVELEKNSVGDWTLPQSTQLSESDIVALSSAGLYLQINTATKPDGALRAQILPGGFENYFTTLVESEVAVPIGGTTSNVSASAGTTLDTIAPTLTVHISSPQLTEASSASINHGLAGENGPLIFEFAQDMNDASHWAITGANLSQAEYEALRNEEFYFTMASPTWPDGEIRGQLLLSQVIDPTNISFSYIQDTIFTPTCASSGCHKGKVPSAGLDLSQGVAFANIVNIPSTQVPSLMLVLPGDASKSYLSHKNAGTAAVGGVMPVRGSLSANQISIIDQWINDGALNN